MAVKDSQWHSIFIDTRFIEVHNFWLRSFLTAVKNVHKKFFFVKNSLKFLLGKTQIPIASP